MKALITNVTFKKEIDGKFGKLYSFEVSYDNKKAYYSSKSKDQTYFTIGKESEFTEEKRQVIGKEKNVFEYLIVKPVMQQKQSSYGKALKKEQSKYSGFAVAYAKDLVIAGRLEFSELSSYATVLFDLMVELDKSIE